MPNTNPSKPTAGAMRAMGLAQLVNKVFAGERVKSTKAGHSGYRVEMAPPEGPSTTNAAKPQERLMLVPVEAREGEVSLLFGTADPALTETTLRSFEHLRVQQGAHFGGELPIDKEDYERVLEKLKAFFEHQGAPVVIAASSAQSAAPKATGLPRKSVAIMVAVVLVVLAVLAFVAVKIR
jgi:hypothetical protein